jgi:hypothetical protein
MIRLPLVIFLAAMCGCTTIHMDVDAPVAGEQARAPLQGQHYYAVLDTFGPPSQISMLPEGFVFLYDSLKEIERQLGISFASVSFGNAFDINLLKFTFGRATLRPQYFVVIFDQQGDVRTAGIYEGKEKIGGSVILQVVFTVIATTDMSYLEVPPVQRDWGLSLVQQPPVALNASGDFASGKVGVEVRGAPTAVGQHTLEMPPAKDKDRR